MRGIGDAAGGKCTEKVDTGEPTVNARSSSSRIWDTGPLVAIGAGNLCNDDDDDEDGVVVALDVAYETRDDDGEPGGLLAGDGIPFCIATLRLDTDDVDEEALVAAAAATIAAARSDRATDNNDVDGLVGDRSDMDTGVTIGNR